MNQYKYHLDKGSKKHTCPSCEKKRFVLYKRTDTGEYLPNQYGRCDREANCGYHRNPYKEGYGKDNNDWQQVIPEEKLYKQKAKNERISISNIPLDILKRTLKDYGQNAFIQNLLHYVPFPFDKEDIERVISQYYLGTISKGGCYLI